MLIIRRAVVCGVCAYRCVSFVSRSRLIVQTRLRLLASKGWTHLKLALDTNLLQRPCSNPLLTRPRYASEGESAPFRRNGVKARSNDVQRCDLTDPVPMLALPLLQLMMLVSPTGRSPHGPAISASWRYAEPRCGACADFCIGRLGATQREAAKAESGLLPKVRDQFTESQAQRMCEVLQARLGLTKVELKTLVVRNPPVLGISIEATVLPRLAALQARLGLSEAELKKFATAQNTGLQH